MSGADELCPAYYRLSGKPERVTGCKSWAEPDAPFAPARPVGALGTESLSRAAFVGLGGFAAALMALFYYFRSRRAAR